MAQYSYREDIELGNQLPTPLPYPAHTTPPFSPPSSPPTSLPPSASRSCPILLSIVVLLLGGLIAIIIYLTVTPKM
ncbi:hypothetical protein L211DRAFT_579118 [Terfezia boudieri ATCC MYA-4762]|uniref:Uncharacterized protein n=1 Tax=Terfezia boudieri ATCC MYA-4762 TaxID=1051890 RepID=A0A3N4LPN4_9PEZI|nr:hypothetical protein L211DRAFT_579118 [Terfezia boudieri ATCC MYA-4762]